MGFGISIMMVFPEKTISLNLPATESKIEYLEADPVVVEKLYRQWFSEKPKQGNFNPCSCVSYAKWKSGINVGSIGAAKNHPINSKEPKVGGLVILRESAFGHLAEVSQVWEETIVISESNHIPCKTGTREINRNDNKIIGYYSE